MRRLWLVALLVAQGACEDQRPSPSAGRVNTIEVQLRDPAPDALGSPEAPIAVQEVTFDVVARDDTGAPLPLDTEIDVYVSFGGVKTGRTAACDASVTTRPIETVAVPGGVLLGHRVALPQAFGPTNVWIEERSAHAIGASPTIYFRNPYIADIQTPPDPAAPNATFCTPFNRKYVVVDRAQGDGKLVVSSVFGNAFAVTDTGAPSFNSIYIYSFGRPPGYIVPGRVLRQFSGNISKFIGFTEVNFPLFEREEIVDRSLLPPPVELSAADLTDIPKLLGAVAGVVRYTGPQCNPEPPNPNDDPNLQNTIDQWRKFNTLLVDASGSGACDSFTSFSVQLPAKVVGGYDPLKNVGKTVSFTGMLKNASGQNDHVDEAGNKITCDAVTPCARGTCVDGICKRNPFNFWTIVVRDARDVSVP